MMSPSTYMTPIMMLQRLQILQTVKILYLRLSSPTPTPVLPKPKGQTWPCKLLLSHNQTISLKWIISFSLGKSLKACHMSHTAISSLFSHGSQTAPVEPSESDSKRTFSFGGGQFLVILTIFL